MAFGSEVGTGHVSIFPSMKGFRSAVDKEMRGAGKSGSNRFSQAFGNGSKIGKSFGGSFKKAFGSSARGVADDVLKPLKRDAAQASSKASAALLNYRQATVNVQQAQERLNSAIARYGSDSTQAQTASINLEKAQLRQATALDKSNDAAERLADAKKALKAAEDELAKGTNTVSGSMKTMASSFSAGFSSISRGQSTFTGLSGALGSLVRSLLGVDAIWKPLGSKIAGFANKAVSSLSGFAVQVGAKIQTGLKGAISAAQQTLKGWGGSIAATVSGIAKPIGAAITAWTQPIRDWGSRTGNTIKTAVATWTAPIRSFGGKIGSAIGDAAGKVGQKLAPVANVAKNYFGNIATAAGAVWSKLPAGAQTAAGAIGSTLGNLASSAGNSFKNLAQNAVAHIKGLATGAVAAIGAGVAAIGGTLVATGKQALGAYATWEQAVGGVDTLFKGASGTVQKYAAEAYKTAGVGANDYMNQVTSFAASLVSSLGGDTAKAAEMGNQAIIDMSDNANKMGTDIQTIQQTYQSLARGNYAMLDNLKLGYGGTKTEMQRLIADANKLPGVMKEGNDLSIDSFADVTEAISRVQKSLGISGTTAKEAATTIEGSVNSMKAAWQNWLAGLGNENADMGALSQQLADSIGTALKNILPRVKVIAQSVVKAIPSLFSDLVTLLPEPFQNAINAIGSVFNGLGEIFKPVQSAIAPSDSCIHGPRSRRHRTIAVQDSVARRGARRIVRPVERVGRTHRHRRRSVGHAHRHGAGTAQRLRHAGHRRVQPVQEHDRGNEAEVRCVRQKPAGHVQTGHAGDHRFCRGAHPSVRRHTPVAGTAHPDDHRTAHERAQLAHAAHRPARVQPAATVGGHHRRAAAGRLADRVDDRPSHQPARLRARPGNPAGHGFR